MKEKRFELTFRETRVTAYDKELDQYYTGEFVNGKLSSHTSVDLTQLIRAFDEHGISRKSK